MNRHESNPEMTERAWELLERIQRQLSARRYEGRSYPQATAPYDRPENADRRRKVA
jgi:hypothetical protein